MNKNRQPYIRRVEYLPLTGAQRWLLDEMPKMKRPGWAAIEFSVKTKISIDEEALRKSTFYLLDRYENLRVKIYMQDNKWIQEMYPMSAAEPFAAYDLSKEKPQERIEKIKQICINTRDWFFLEKGNFIKILFFKFSESEGRIWFYMHHIISDFVSALLLSSEFMTTYNSIIQKKELKRQQSKDFRKWQYLVEGYSRDIVLPSELEYWLSLPWHEACVLPSDYPDKFHSNHMIGEGINGKKFIDCYRNVSLLMTEEETFNLVNRYGVDFESVLIAVFFLALAGKMNVDCLDITASYSGRNVLPLEYASSENRLVGYIAEIRVLLLRNPRKGNVLVDIGDVIEQLKDIPANGIGYRLIMEHVKNEQLKDSFKKLRKTPQILFNYLGRANTNIHNDQFELIKEDIGQDNYPPEIKNSIFECSAGINQGRLYLALSYIDEYTRRETTEAILHLMTRTLRDLGAYKKDEKNSVNNDLQ